MPEWGSQEERGIDMEVATAAANLTGGADAVIMRHPAAVATIKKFITRTGVIGKEEHNYGISKVLDIFKLSPKKNCKECGCPTCMAFCMKVAQGALPHRQVPVLLDPDAVAMLSEATAPPMKTLEVGTGANAHKLGGETVLFRHEKTLVTKNLFAVNPCAPACPPSRNRREDRRNEESGLRAHRRADVSWNSCSAAYVGNGADKYVELVQEGCGRRPGHHPGVLGRWKPPRPLWKSARTPSPSWTARPWRTGRL